jgi:hypothetical protein
LERNPATVEIKVIGYGINFLDKIFTVRKFKIVRRVEPAATPANNRL